MLKSYKPQVKRSNNLRRLTLGNHTSNATVHFSQHISCEHAPPVIWLLDSTHAPRDRLSDMDVNIVTFVHQWCKISMEHTVL